MCTHLRRITNKYTGDDMYVKCGHCKACLMEKANSRKERIENEIKDGYLYLFVTLTYDRMSCPFVYLDDLLNKSDYLNVYRAHTTRLVPYVNKDGLLCYHNRRTYSETLLKTCIMPDYTDVFKSQLPCLKKFGARVGVVFYDDLKNFVKRLRINLERNYNYVEKIKFFACSEYGPQTQRPHFHLLTLVRGCDVEIVRNAIVKSWPFAYNNRTEKYIQIARSAASYVATYVNCNTVVHPFLSTNFAAKHSYSKYFGFGNELFSLSSVLEMLGRKDMSYLFKSFGEQSKLSLVPLPKYVINRYFPYFKGITSLSDSEICEFIQFPQKFASVTYNGLDDQMRPLAFLSETRLPRIKEPSLYSSEPYISYYPDDLNKIIVRLNNAFSYYHQITGRGRLDFALDYVDVWRCYKSTCFRLWRSDDDLCDLYKFDNLVDLVNGIVNSPFHIDYFNELISNGSVFIVNPNNFPQNISKDVNLGWLFDVKDKSRKITNFVMSSNGHYV